MTAPDHFAKTELNPFAGGGRPHMNFNYQRIIGIGPAALPLIIEELRVRGGRWFWALRAITGIDPTDTADQGNATKMKGAWLRWWEQTE